MRSSYDGQRRIFPRLFGLNILSDFYDFLQVPTNSSLMGRCLRILCCNFEVCFCLWWKFAYYFGWVAETNLWDSCKGHIALSKFAMVQKVFISIQYFGLYSIFRTEVRVCICRHGQPEMLETCLVYFVHQTTWSFMHHHFTYEWKQTWACNVS